MPSYRELLAQVKAEIEEVDAAGARELETSALVVDVRELGRVDRGTIPGASTSRAASSSRASKQRRPTARNRSFSTARPGARSAFAAKSLEELGYENVVSLAGGYTDWKRNGFPTELPRSLDAAKRQRYSRHILIPEVGEEGQLKLLDSRSC